MANPAGEPVVPNNFFLEIDGVALHLIGIDGLAMEITTTEHSSISAKGKRFQKVLPGSRKDTGEITCRTYLHPADDMARWFFRVASGKPEPKNASVIVCDYTGGEVQRWNLFDIWPSKLSWPTLDAKADGPPEASVTLQYDRLEVG
jgi:phage tail-like protein